MERRAIEPAERLGEGPVEPEIGRDPGDQQQAQQGREKPPLVAPERRRRCFGKRRPARGRRDPGGLGLEPGHARMVAQRLDRAGRDRQAILQPCRHLGLEHELLQDPGDGIDEDAGKDHVRQEMPALHHAPQARPWRRAP